jgi:hypothetical protein
MHMLNYSRMLVQHKVGSEFCLELLVLVLRSTEINFAELIILFIMRTLL